MIASSDLPEAFDLMVDCEFNLVEPLAAQLVSEFLGEVSYRSRRRQTALSTSLHSGWTFLSCFYVPHFPRYFYLVKENHILYIVLLILISFYSIYPIAHFSVYFIEVLEYLTRLNLPFIHLNFQNSGASGCEYLNDNSDLAAFYPDPKTA